MLSTEPLEAVRESKGIFVGLLEGGATLRLQADSPAELIEPIKRCTISWVNFAVSDLTRDGNTVASIMGFSSSLMEVLLRERYSNYEDRGVELGLLLPVIRVEGLDVRVNKLIILIRKGLILTLHEAEKVTRTIKFARYADTIIKKIPQNLAPNDKITVLLARLLSENNDRNYDGLRSIEEAGDRISAYLLDPQTPRQALGGEIYKMKHALITYLNTLWATMDVIQSLRYGDADLVSDDETLLRRIGILGDEVTRQISLGEHMSEVLASGLEVLQSIYNNQLQILNNRMSLVITYLTIVGTAVLVPNTIATVLSTGAFTIGPQDAWWYILLLIISTIGATWLAYWIIKKKGWLPQTTA